MVNLRLRKSKIPQMVETKYISLEFVPSSIHPEMGRAHLNLAQPSEIKHEPLGEFFVSRDEAIKGARARGLIFIQTNLTLEKEVLASRLQD